MNSNVCRVCFRAFFRREKIIIVSTIHWLLKTKKIVLVRKMKRSAFLSKKGLKYALNDHF